MDYYKAKFCIAVIYNLFRKILCTILSNAVITTENTTCSDFASISNFCYPSSLPTLTSTHCNDITP